MIPSCSQGTSDPKWGSKLNLSLINKNCRGPDISELSVYLSVCFTNAFCLLTVQFALTFEANTETIVTSGPLKVPITLQM